MSNKKHDIKTKNESISVTYFTYVHKITYSFLNLIPVQFPSVPQNLWTAHDYGHLLQSRRGTLKKAIQYF